MAELPDRFDPAQLESDIYQRWLSANAFTADASRSNRVGGDRTPFTIVMPPPNVTAILHVGHGLNNTIQDVVIRWARMRGTEALWVPGTDHAGIATQNVVERLIAIDGSTRFDLGRQMFVKRTEDFVAETGGAILAQLKAIGASADWSRTAYTLSPELSHSVRTAFVRLYERGLIYRGHRVIHWCPRCLTSLSDEEAEFRDEPGFLYHIKYAVTGDPTKSVTIATTRPETLLADVAVAVNPKDKRYKHLVGKTVTLPIVGIEIPVIADDYADPTFGTGVVKITPAHDSNDFDVGLRHKLPMPVVIDENAIVREVEDAAGRVPPSIAGLDRFIARERVVALLEESGALVKTEPHQHAVRHCYRCDTVVEPRLSDQWFVKMEPLARPALQAVRDGAIRILPERWEAVYVNWMTNIRDWNISRQLWWGHRIPVYYCDECDPPNKINVSIEPLTECPHCGCPVRQDEDVLDTWFSSWLWPLSTLGWPNRVSADIKAFYPTDVLITAPEILFFWVARMIMAGYEFEGRAPFHTVYLHGTVRDTNHMKMSKSLGNGIDPLEVVTLYGADALRWTMVAGMGMGADVILDPKDLDKSFATGRNFATKLWNIGRFILGAVGDEKVQRVGDVDSNKMTRADKWILARLDEAISECDAALGPMAPGAGVGHHAPPRAKRGERSEGSALGDKHFWLPEQRYAGLRLNEYAETARRFVWNELADWYVETAKGRLNTPGADRDVARAVLVHAFDQALRLLHPIVPFVTEALWQKLPSRPKDALLATSEWPKCSSLLADARRDDDVAAPRDDGFPLIRETILAIRQIRATYNVTPGKQIDVHIHPAGADAERLFKEESATISRMSRATVSVGGKAPGGAAAHAIISGSELTVPLAGLVDVAKECERLRGELADLMRQIESRSGRLSNAKYVERAPPAVVESDRAILAEMQGKARQLEGKVATLCG
jgi:valyl-tRNA synthetase